MDSHILRLTIEGVLGCFALAIAACADRSFGRRIVRWRAAKLPEGPDAERAQEELEGVVDDLKPAERVELAGQILLRPAALRREIAERAAARKETTRASGIEAEAGRETEFLEEILDSPNCSPAAVFALSQMRTMTDAEIASGFNWTEAEVRASRYELNETLNRMRKLTEGEIAFRFNLPETEVSGFLTRLARIELPER